MKDSSGNNLTFTERSVFRNALCYDYFVAAYGLDVTSNAGLTKRQLSSVYERNASNPNQYQTPSVISNVDLPSPSHYNRDIILFPTIPNDALSNIANDLRTLKIAYQVLEPKVFQEIQATKAWPAAGVDSITLNGSNIQRILPSDTTLVNNLTASGTLFNYIANLDPKKQDIFAFRRLVLGTYIVLHIFFAMNALINSQSDTGNNNKANATQLCLFYYEKLRVLNQFYESSDLNTSNKGGSALSNSIKRYDTIASRLDEIDKDLRSSRSRLKTETSLASAARKDASEVNQMRTAAIALACIFFASLFAVAILPLDFGMRMKIAGALGLAALVVAIVLIRLSKKVTESFAGLTAGGAFASTTSASVSAGLQMLMNLVIMEEFRNFLSYTEDATLYLRTHRLYTQVSSSMNKERTFFENTSEQTDRNVAKTKNAKLILERNARIMAAFVTFVVQLVVIIVFMVIGTLALSEKLPKLRYLVYTLGGILAFAALMVFLADVLGRTHVDGKKQYWGTPELVNSI